MAQCQHKNYKRGRERGCYHCTQWANTNEAMAYARSKPIPEPRALDDVDGDLAEIEAIAEANERRQKASK